MGVTFRNIRELSNIKTSPNNSIIKQYDPITDTGYYGAVDARIAHSRARNTTLPGLTQATYIMIISAAAYG